MNYVASAVIEDPGVIEADINDSGARGLEAEIGSEIDIDVLVPDYTIYEARANYVHTQGVPSSHWIINHNLNKYCSITVVDSSKQIVIPQVTYVDTNTVIVDMTDPFAGWAYCN